MSPVSAKDVLRPYEMHLSAFNKDQNSQWTFWKGQLLPDRVAEVKNKHLKTGGKLGWWQNVNHLFVILSAAIPIIVGILVNVFSVSSLASLLDAVFPAMVGVVHTKLSMWSERRHALSQVVSPYSTLLANIVLDISYKKYSNETHKLYQGKWDNLNAITIPFL